MSATISVAMASESHGWVIAHIPSEDRLVMGTTLVVGSICGNNGWDSEPGKRPELKAWLFPFPGGAIRLGTHCEAVTGPDAEVLRAKLQKHADGQGRWWERGAA